MAKLSDFMLQLIMCIWSYDMLNEIPELFKRTNSDIYLLSRVVFFRVEIEDFNMNSTIELVAWLLFSPLGSAIFQLVFRKNLSLLK